MTIGEKAQHYSSIVRAIEAQIEILESILELEDNHYSAGFLYIVDKERTRLIELIKEN